MRRIIKEKKVWRVLGMALVTLLTLTSGAEAKSRWMTNVILLYPGASRLHNCAVCHRGFDSRSGGENSYGVAFKRAGGSSDPTGALVDIENQDSDGDGSSNIAEILTGEGFMPGFSCDDYTSSRGGPANLADFVDPGNIGCLSGGTTTTVTTSTTTTSTTTVTVPPTTSSTTTSTTLRRQTTTTAPAASTTTTTTTTSTTSTTIPDCPGCEALDFLPVADTYIEARRGAGLDHGRASHVRVDRAPFGVTYLKFDVSRVTGVIARAELELYVTNRSKDAGSVYRIFDSSWEEGIYKGRGRRSRRGSGLKWTDVDTNGDGSLDERDHSPLVPDPINAIANLGRVKKRSRYRVDVTAAFQAGPGIHTLAIMNQDRDGASFASREHRRPDRRPVLHIFGEVEGGAVCGDGALTPPEECDGALDAACPGACLPDCSCAEDTRDGRGGGGNPGGGVPGDQVLFPIADTYIEQGTEETWDHGASDHLDVDASPFGVTYIKFDLSHVRGTVTAAELELYVTNKSRDGGRVYPIFDSRWVEGTGNGVDPSSARGNGLKWYDVDTNRDGKLDSRDSSRLVPGLAASIASLGVVERGVSYRLDVTSAFQDGPAVYTLAITNSSADGTTFSSRETPDWRERPLLHLSVR